jgi:predicted nucleic acid-binding protein
MRILLDTSALVKRYALEPGRERVVALSEAATELCVAAHCKLEVASALNRRQCEGSLDKHGAERAWSRVQEEFAEMTVVPLSLAVEEDAVAALLGASLRGCDALHIGSAQAARVDLFVTADRRQAEAAERRGLPTELIET